ncbi:MAG: RecX family transcriptional regulator [Candidatus Omnitrophica bacterium]|nr:RecX family transcriptional regulator [Candidatus Omnitrophota bacterium]
MLNIRPRSEQEIRERLRQKHLSDSDVNRTVQYFKELDLINDRQFARQWICSRLRKPFGPKRIRMELRRKGIAEHIVDAELEHLLPDYPEEDSVRTLINARAERNPDTDPQKRKRRLMEYLQRRGFGLAVIIKALNDYDS